MTEPTTSRPEPFWPVSLDGWSMLCGILAVIFAAFVLPNCANTFSSIAEISGLCFVGSIAAAAIIMGVIARRSIKKSSAMAIVGIITGGLGILFVLAITSTSIATERRIARNKECVHQLLQITLALKAYANDDLKNHEFPPSLSLLVKSGYLTDVGLFNDPSNPRPQRITSTDEIDRKSDYVYVGAGLKDAESCSDAILLYCGGYHQGLGGTHWHSVSYVDGHAVFTHTSEKTIQEKMTAQRAATKSTNP